MDLLPTKCTIAGHSLTVWDARSLSLWVIMNRPFPMWNYSASQQPFPPSLLPRTWQAPKAVFSPPSVSSPGRISIATGNSLFPWSFPCWRLILYLRGSTNALLWAHECRYFVNLLHSGDWDNSLFRMEKRINRIFNEMTVSFSYTWTKNCKWLCNVLYTCFFLQIALQAICNSQSTYPPSEMSSFLTYFLIKWHSLISAQPPKLQ